MSDFKLPIYFNALISGNPIQTISAMRQVLVTRIVRGDISILYLGRTADGLRVKAIDFGNKVVDDYATLTWELYAGEMIPPDMMRKGN